LLHKNDDHCCAAIAAADEGDTLRVARPMLVSRIYRKTQHGSVTTLNTNSPTTPPVLEGKMYLYRQPELLNHERHGALGINQPARPFDFAREARVLPLTLPELTNAQMFYPIIFTDLDNPLPLAVVGMNDDINLFVEEDGHWATGTYIPAYARCYPFSLAAGAKDQFAVVIDRAADMISEAAEQPFFGEGKITPQTQSMIDFCGRYDAERRSALEFGRQLTELGLLAGHTATRTSQAGEQQTVANYIAVDKTGLAKLGPETLVELMENGYLACIFAHIFSLDNWPRLVERHTRRSAERTTD
jgi:hypothetical protein